MAEFEAYSGQHYGALIVFVLFTWLVIRIGRRQNWLHRMYLGVILGCLPVLFTFSGILIDLFNGTFDHREDLPLHLCRLLAFVLPFLMYLKNPRWLSIFYFWIMAGTFQALLTPDLAEGFPQFWYFRYWVLHCGLVTAILYAVIVYGLRPGWKDLWWAVFATQGYLVVVHAANYFLGSNYSYTMRKPPDGSILDLLGPWPWYILSGQGIMLVLFVLLLSPFLILKKKR